MSEDDIIFIKGIKDTLEQLIGRVALLEKRIIWLERWHPEGFHQEKQPQRTGEQ